MYRICRAMLACLVDNYLSALPASLCALGADISASANLSPYSLYGTTGELAAACDADPACLAFSSNGFAGRLKGASFLAGTTGLLDTEGPAVANLCVYLKHSGEQCVRLFGVHGT